MNKTFQLFVSLIATALVSVGLALLLISSPARADSSSSISTNPTSYDYGAVAIGSTESESIEILNSSTADANVSSIAVGGNNVNDFTITQNSCSSVIPTMGNCSVVVTFQPSVEGSESGELDVTTDQGSSVTPLTGTGITPANFSASPTSNDFGNQQQSTVSSPQIFTISNTGQDSMSITGVLVVGTNADQFNITSDGCTDQNLSLNDSCQVQVTFNPSANASGEQDAQLQFSDTASNSDNGVNSIALSGTAITPASINISPQNNSFGSQDLNTNSDPQTFTVSNSGEADLNISQVALSGANSNQFNITQDGCSNSIVPGGSNCTVQVEFTPNGTSGSDEAQLNVDSDAGNVTSLLTGTATSLATISPSTSSISFGSEDLGTNNSQQVTISNSGNDSMTVGPISVGDPSQFNISQDECSNQTITGGSNCTFVVSYTPTVGGPADTNITIPNNSSNSNSGQTSIAVSGQGLTPPSIAISPASQNFGSVGEGSASNVQTFTVANTGDQMLSIGEIDIEGISANQFGITSDQCVGAVIAVGASCTVAVQFSPTLQGIQQAQLVTYSNASNNSSSGSVFEQLTGTGLSPASALASPSSQDFGSLTIDQTSTPTTFTVTNNGDYPLQMQQAFLSGSNPGQFTLPTNSDMCSGQTLNAGSSCTLQVQFTPGSIGIFNAQLVIPSNDPNSPLEIPLQGSSTAPSIPISINTTPPSVTTPPITPAPPATVITTKGINTLAKLKHKVVESLVRKGVKIRVNVTGPAKIQVRLFVSESVIRRGDRNANNRRINAATKVYISKTVTVRLAKAGIKAVNLKVLKKYDEILDHAGAITLGINVRVTKLVSSS